MVQIGLIGEFRPATVPGHAALPKALELAAADLDGVSFMTECVRTDELLDKPEQRLAQFQALWFLSATPYASIDGALTAIAFAREQGVPALGSCGGSQHIVIEYARNVLGLREADHAESNPAGPVLLITPLMCAYNHDVAAFNLAEGSRVAELYGRIVITEEYGVCHYGPNAAYWPALEQGGLRISGRDEDGQARVVEIPEHPFFIGTLFQPELSARQNRVHPLIRGLLQAALER